MITPPIGYAPYCARYYRHLGRRIRRALLATPMVLTSLLLRSGVILNHSQCTHQRKDTEDMRNVGLKMLGLLVVIAATILSANTQAQTWTHVARRSSTLFP